jgi:hypothetical protein
VSTLPDAKAGVSTINEYMLKKQGIPVGVNMQGKPGPNQNAATEHFVNISGYGSDNKGTYYTFHDPAAPNQAQGTSMENRLRINSDNSLTGSTVYAPRYNYEVTEVRPY